jgi:type IX secretion system PorP/SprF family membrane protein
MMKLSIKNNKNEINRQLVANSLQLITNGQKPKASSQQLLSIKLLLVLLLISFAKLSAQDALFTNYLNTPLQTNPALVAFDNDFKIALNYRGRISKLSQSYNTPVLSVIYPLINQDKSKRWGGIGFSVLSDLSDNSKMIKTTGANLAFAYNLQLNNIQYISASLGAGYFRREVNINNLSTGSQYVSNQGYDPTIPINENFTNNTKGFLDISAGVIWQLTDKDGLAKAFAGVSAFHLNQPDISLNEEKDELPFRYGFQAGYKVFSNEKLSLFPDAGIDYQTEVLRYNVGLTINVPLQGFENGYLENASISFKPRYVSDNLASLGIEFRKPDYVISFTYDFGVVNRSINSNVVDAYEVYVGYKKTLFKPKKKKEKIIIDHDYIVGTEREFKKNTEVVVIKDTVYKESENNVVEKEWKEKVTTPERRITFNYSSDKVEDEAKDVLNEIVQYLKENEDYMLEIEGHTDNIGDTESNQRHSLRRAKAISNYLVKQGVLSSRIRVTGKGESKPIATNATEEGRAKNRRVEFRLYRVVK